MKLNKFVLLLFTLLFFTTTIIFAQQAPFYNDVIALKKKDSTAFPAKNSILFTGSSSFTKWTDVQDYFPGVKITNRAFGGSTLLDLIHYADEVILPYQPKQVAIYCGENDLAFGKNVTPQMVLTRFTTLFGIIRNRYPQIPVLFVSLKPSPSRAALMPEMVETNHLIKSFLKKKKHTAFADVYTKMLLPDGSPDPTLFVADNLHMNAKGYAIWQKVLAPYLVKN